MSGRAVGVGDRGVGGRGYFSSSVNERAIDNRYEGGAVDEEDEGDGFSSLYVPSSISTSMDSGRFLYIGNGGRGFFVGVGGGFCHLKVTEEVRSCENGEKSSMAHPGTAFACGGAGLKPNQPATFQNARRYCFFASLAKPKRAKKRKAQNTDNHRVSSTAIS